MKLFDQSDLESAEAEGVKAGAQAERTRLLAVFDTSEGKRDLGAAMRAALTDPTVTSENIRERLQTQPAKGSATPMSIREEVYKRLNGSRTESGDVDSRMAGGK